MREDKVDKYYFLEGGRVNSTTREGGFQDNDVVRGVRIENVS